jgi:hypothetical protein
MRSGSPASMACWSLMNRCCVVRNRSSSPATLSCRQAARWSGSGFHGVVRSSPPGQVMYPWTAKTLPFWTRKIRYRA